MSVANTELKSHLRLVTTESTPEPVITDRRARDLTQLPPHVRQLRRTILAEALAQGTPINPDAVSVILAAKMASDAPLMLFTEDIVWDLVWFDICNWCGLRRLDIPWGITEAMWFVLHFLTFQELLDPASDHVEDLCAPLQTSSGLDGAGQPRFPFS